MGEVVSPVFDFFPEAGICSCMIRIGPRHQSMNKRTRAVWVFRIQRKLSHRWSDVSEPLEGGASLDPYLL